MKKSTALFLELMLLMSIASGCSNGTSDATETPEATKPAVSSSEGAKETEEVGQEPGIDPLAISLPLVEETVELSYWYTFPTVFSTVVEGPEYCLYFQEMEKHTNVHINFRVSATNAGSDNDYVATVEQMGISDVINVKTAALKRFNSR